MGRAWRPRLASETMTGAPPPPSGLSRRAPPTALRLPPAARRQVRGQRPGAGAIPGAARLQISVAERRSTGEDRPLKAYNVNPGMLKLLIVDSRDIAPESARPRTAPAPFRRPASAAPGATASLLRCRPPGVFGSYPARLWLHRVLSRRDGE